MTEQELNKACEVVRDLANEHFGDWEQSCKFEDNFRKAMEGISGNKREIPSNSQGMSNDEAINILKHWADGLWIDEHGITNGDFDIAVDIACKALNPSNSCNSDKNLQELTWRTDTPPVDTEVICKIKGVPYAEYFICKWDGKHWWHWNFFNSETQGWFGLNGGWEVEAWKGI